VCCAAAEIRFTNPAIAHKKAEIQDQPEVALFFGALYSTDELKRPSNLPITGHPDG
jgi:hypothetical protein